ncbi:2-Hydroxyacid oxidase 1-like [Uranotaenia lowii]|uniref:2-Hydroxyacid oxidase 1-like n=1 Tax=Uranotaenia lowii TaxID=190385 RepID=UPI0024798DF4|nr:2-Hydroxyacid oxidase 1-like [Uranotaenia lowii]
MFDTLFRGKRSDRRTREITCLEEYEERAAESVDREVLDYFRAGAGGGQAMRLNRSCFDKIRIRPRCLTGVGNRSMAIQVLGSHFKMPIGIGPVPLQKLLSNDGEKATARAARSLGAPFILGALASVSIEDIAEAIPKVPKWFQMYIFKDRELMENMVRRAEKARFAALVVTVDTPVLGLRKSDLRNPLNVTSKVSYVNFLPPYNNVCSKNIAEYVKSQFDPTLGWESLKWLIDMTHLPVIVKGILSSEDALMAAKMGAKGIIVSNHGGCQLDSAPASIEVLPEIVEAVGTQCCVMLDGGIMRGSDVFKALALGAQTVFIGRPAMYGLAVGGQSGVEDVLDLLRLELDSVMASAGCRTLEHICGDSVRLESEYLRPRLKIPPRKSIDIAASCEGDTQSGKLITIPFGPPPETLIPTGEDGLAKDPRGKDAVDDCGIKTSQWSKEVNHVEVVPMRPPRLTREVRVVPDVAKVLQRNIKADIARRDHFVKNKPYRNRAYSMQNLDSINKMDDVRCSP